MKHRLIDSTPKVRATPNLSGSGIPLVDGVGRAISYLRLSITDRCDLRCTYCMPERVKFVPKAELLHFDELNALVGAFVARGITKLRITGGEPLVRRDSMALMRQFATYLGHDLDELSITTNGTLLTRYADDLYAVGVRRINISLDTLNPKIYAALSRRDVFDDVMAGIMAAKRAGLKVKINTVALANHNRHDIPELIEWAHGEGFDISLIETMPMGEISSNREDDYLPLQEVRNELKARWSMTVLPDNTGGPSRYMHITQTGGRVGFITPMSHNFCADCNRIRVDCRGQLYTCLGHEDGADLRSALRAESDQTLDQLLDGALRTKPVRHNFSESAIATPSVARTMSHTGG